MTDVKQQQEFEYKADERDWTAVKLLVEELKEEMAERREPPLFENFRLALYIKGVQEGRN